MKRIFTIIIGLLLIAIIVLSSTFVASGYNIYSYNSYSKLNNVRLVQNEHYSFIVGTSGKYVEIDEVYPNNRNISLSLDNTVDSFTLCNDTLVMLCYLYSSSQIEVVLYNTSSNIHTSFYINGDIEYLDSHIVYASGFLYLAQENGEIKQYNSKGKCVNEFSLDTQIASLICDYSENVYALTHSGMYYINSSYTKISNTEFVAQGCFVTDDIIVDYIGNYYQIQNNYVNKIVDFYSTASHISGGVYKNYAISCYDDTIYAFSIDDGKKKMKLNLNKEIVQLCVIDDIIIVLCNDSNIPTVTLVSFSELTIIPNKNNNSDYGTDTDDNKTGLISSDVYTVDYDNMKITGITASTTVSEFKKNMQYDGYDVQFYRYGADNTFTSGNVGTATLAIFYNDEISYEFELCVTGDLTGEGNVNSRDKNVMFDYLLDNITFNGVFIDASDLNSSGEIKVEDLVLLLRLIEDQK